MIEIYDFLKDYIAETMNLKEYILRDDEGNPIAFDGSKFEDELSDRIHDVIYHIRIEYENDFDSYEE